MQSQLPAKKYAATRFSALDEINGGNVSHLEGIQAVDYGAGGALARRPGIPDAILCFDGVRRGDNELLQRLDDSLAPPSRRFSPTITRRFCRMRSAGPETLTISLTTLQERLS
jgi:hypothetical protein